MRAYEGHLIKNLQTGDYPSKKVLTVNINMQNDDNNPEVILEQEDNQTEVVEETTPEADTPPQEPVVAKEEGIKLSPAEFRHYKKWKDSQGQPQKVASSPQSASPQPSNVEEVVLLANGMSEELVGELKAVAKARGINSLIKAQNDPIFVAVKEKFEKDKKQKDASLGASRGSGATRVQKNFTTPGLSREEHMKMINSL